MRHVVSFGTALFCAVLKPKARRLFLPIAVGMHTFFVGRYGNNKPGILTPPDYTGADNFFAVSSKPVCRFFKNSSGLTVQSFPYNAHSSLYGDFSKLHMGGKNTL